MEDNERHDKECLSNHMEELEKQRKLLHDAVDSYVNKVLSVGKTWLRKPFDNRQLYIDIEFIVQACVTLLIQKCTEIIEAERKYFGEEFRECENQIDKSSVKTEVPTAQERQAKILVKKRQQETIETSHYLEDGTSEATELKNVIKTQRRPRKQKRPTAATEEKETAAGSPFSPNQEKEEVMIPSTQLHQLSLLDDQLAKFIQQELQDQHKGGSDDEIEVNNSKGMGTDHSLALKIKTQKMAFSTSTPSPARNSPPERLPIIKEAMSNIFTPSSEFMTEKHPPFTELKHETVSDIQESMFDTLKIVKEIATTTSAAGALKSPPLAKSALTSKESMWESSTTVNELMDEASTSIQAIIAQTSSAVKESKPETVTSVREFMAGTLATVKELMAGALSTVKEIMAESVSNTQESNPETSTSGYEHFSGLSTAGGEFTSDTSNMTESMSETSTSYNDFIQEPSAMGSDPEWSQSNTSSSSSKRKSNPQNWKKNIQKVKKLRGEEHISRNGHVIQAKKLSAVDCTKCKLKCTSHFSEDKRQTLFTKFYALASNEKQKDFVCQYVEESLPKLTWNEDGSIRNKRQVVRKYYLPLGGSKRQVCMNFFKGTLAVGNMFIAHALANKKDGHYCGKEKRGMPNNRLPKQSIDAVRNHIKSFPVMECYDTRDNTTHLYLDQNLNVCKMYRLYLKMCAEENLSPLKLSSYRHIFKTEFNLSFFKP